MDQNGKIYNLLDQASFNQWMTEFFNKKSNQLEYSITSQPKRMEKLTLDLSTANSSGYKVPVPFKSCVVSRIYSTATGTDKAGSVRILFDQPNIGNLKNAVNLFVNDTLTGETLFSESYLLWDAQADTTIEIYFFPDIQVSTGTTKTQIVGNVSVTNSSTLALYNRSILPTSRQILNAPFNSANLTTTAIPTGYYGKVSFMGQQSSFRHQAYIGGVQLFDFSAAVVDAYVTPQYTVLAGETVNIQTGGTGTGCMSAILEVYPII